MLVDMHLGTVIISNIALLTKCFQYCYGHVALRVQSASIAIDVTLSLAGYMGELWPTVAWLHG